MKKIKCSFLILKIASNKITHTLFAKMNEKVIFFFVEIYRVTGNLGALFLVKALYIHINKLIN